MNETAWEKAEGLTISHREALRWLSLHYQGAEDVAEFEASEGTDQHQAQDVLAWLGY